MVVPSDRITLNAMRAADEIAARARDSLSALMADGDLGRADQCRARCG